MVMKYDIIIHILHYAVYNENIFKLNKYIIYKLIIRQIIFL